MSVLLDKAKSLRSEGKKFKEIAKELSCSEGYLRKNLAGFVRERSNYNQCKIELSKIQESTAILLKLLESV